MDLEPEKIQNDEKESSVKAAVEKVTEQIVVQEPTTKPENENEEEKVAPNIEEQKSVLDEESKDDTESEDSSDLSSVGDFESEELEDPGEDNESYIPSPVGKGNAKRNTKKNITLIKASTIKLPSTNSNKNR